MEIKSFNGIVLVVDDDSDIQEVLKDRLESLGYQVLLGSNGKEGLELLEKRNPHMVLLDVEMPGMNGLQVLREIRRRGHDVTVVMITAYGTIERAVQAMKEGAYDFIPKPFEPDHIALLVEKALERERLKRGVDLLTEEIGERYRMVVGHSPQMGQAIDLAEKAAASKSTVLLLGESGTGKEIFARAIHRWSERKEKPFVAINCVGLSRELLESELFGHEKGAFTGATEVKKGKIELAHGGTVFLDEVGDVSPEIQTKLLRFLQEREFERVGGTKTIQVDVRIIAATNRDLERAVTEGRFREDLFYRLNVVPICLPPLRERKEEVPALAHYFMQRFSKETKKTFVEITREALEKLSAYAWPGNVRELANAIERAIVLGSGPNITVRDLAPRISAAEPKTLSEALSYRDAINAAKKQLIVMALRQTQGNRAAAARALGLQRTYLSRLIRTLRIP
ncbi:MAG: sigma-54-dependent Fis family transcriptional regulator [Deltaproteobacteria bacterium]|nr:sigma-54-dependent Fis family transcriptional regulator [Deltaproteobacteria bacterium]